MERSIRRERLKCAQMCMDVAAGAKPKGKSAIRAPG